MASALNKDTRKRKSTSDLIFEVDEGDFSPTLTPEPNEETKCELIKETNDCQTSNDSFQILNETSTKLNENIVEQIKDSVCDTVSDKMVDQMSSTESKVIKSDDSNSHQAGVTSVNNTAPTEQSTDTKEEGLIIKPDVDLRCMDMEVANSPPPVVNTEKPFISVIFRDKDAINYVGAKIMNYIKSVVEYECNLKISTSQSDFNIDFWEDNRDSLPRRDVQKYLNDIETKTKPEPLDLFVVDTTPSKKPELLPRYTPTNHCKTIGEPEKVAKSDSVRRPVQVCFNCEGDHAIKDCTEVRNPRRIAMARNKFRAQHKNVRYHIDNDSKYGHLVPGKISVELRRALDVRKNEIPPYIYRMRTLGYPPGWLQEAMATNSNLELFDFHGCVINDEKKEMEKKIDSSKIIEFAGFNAPLEKGFRDDFKYYNCPPYSEKYSKECMVEYIERTSESKQTIKHAESKESQATCSKQAEQDAEKTRRSESPSLNDLELRKKQLLAELDDGNLNSPQTTDETNDKSINPLSKDLIESPVVVSSSFGTPIIKTDSPFVQLPERDKFSKDICPVINFENLPDSTGKYEQMSVVINKVRQTVKNIKS